MIYENDGEMKRQEAGQTEPENRPSSSATD